jgi:alanyl-tRNA synthetase
MVHIGDGDDGHAAGWRQRGSRSRYAAPAGYQRNHTATHLLHAELHAVLGEHARQAGSLVAPDRLRFDFTHPEALTLEELEQIEARVNQAIMENHRLNITFKPLKEAMAEGAMALFGEKYGETVRTITIGGAEPFSYELCGGTHVGETGDIGIFLITSEGSAAAGVRRIEAVTGRGRVRAGAEALPAVQAYCGLAGIERGRGAQQGGGAANEVERLTNRWRACARTWRGSEFGRSLESVPVVGVCRC